MIVMKWISISGLVNFYILCVRDRVNKKKKTLLLHLKKKRRRDGNIPENILITCC